MNHFALSLSGIKLAFVVSIEMNEEGGGKVLLLMSFLKQAEQGVVLRVRKELDHLSTFETSLTSRCIILQKYAHEVTRSSWNTCRLSLWQATPDLTVV